MVLKGEAMNVRASPTEAEIVALNADLAAKMRARVPVAGARRGDRSASRRRPATLTLRQRGRRPAKRPSMNSTIRLSRWSLKATSSPSTW